ncbi:GAP family protein [Mariniluteicoccus endophyticus]
MDITTALGLAGLALVDSLSFGTLGIPVFLLVQRRVRAGVLLGYLATIATFYWGLGLALVLGAGFLARVGSGLGDNRTVSWVQLYAGVALFAVSWLFDGKRAARRREERKASGAGPTRHERWKARLADGDVPAGLVVGVALAAGLVEAASMLPYLGAVGLLSQAHLPPLGTGAALAAYVIVMVAPALLLLALRLLLRSSLEPALVRLGGWLERSSDEMLGWVLGIVGALLALDAASRLGNMQVG